MSSAYDVRRGVSQSREFVNFLPVASTNINRSRRRGGSVFAVKEGWKKTEIRIRGTRKRGRGHWSVRREIICLPTAGACKQSFEPRNRGRIYESEISLDYSMKSLSTYQLVPFLIWQFEVCSFNKQTYNLKNVFIRSIFRVFIL